MQWWGPPPRPTAQAFPLLGRGGCPPSAPPFSVAMQKLLQQLPASAANLVKSQQSGAGEEAKSPVLVPDGSPQTWYSTLEGDECRLLKAPDQEAAVPPESSADSSVAQPLR